MAGALVDDEAPSSTKGATPTASSSKTTSASAPTVPPQDLPNQKVGLLKALLTVGDVTHSLFILTQWPILVHAFPEIADLLNRLLSVSVESAYSAISISRRHSQWAEEFVAERSRSVLDSKGEKKVLIPEIKKLITGEPFPDPRGRWTFFFPGWDERTPKAGDAEELLVVLEKTFMPFLGIFISRDFSLFSKICRIIKNDLNVCFLTSFYLPSSLFDLEWIFVSKRIFRSSLFYFASPFGLLPNSPIRLDLAKRDGSTFFEFTFSLRFLSSTITRYPRSRSGKSLTYSRSKNVSNSTENGKMYGTARFPSSGYAKRKLKKKSNRSYDDSRPRM